ncbi:MAG: GTP cyclohydrolase [Proteobacteria bacterium]|nr:GTP cyclohydrolase [Pseudomonadota bacterium]
MSFLTPDTFINEIKTYLARAEEHRRQTGRPFCTLAYAQSIDGSIACNPLHRIDLSGQESMTLTHQLRAMHRAILVGIRTVLADNPTLSVRRIPGQNPQPVVLDTRLRTPLSSNLFNHGKRQPWIATIQGADVSRQRRLETKGAHVFRFPSDEHGWVTLEPLLHKMAEMGINSLMVEGGARVLTSFMRARLANQVVITIAPLIVGGVSAFNRLTRDQSLLPRLRKVRYAHFGVDLTAWGYPSWEEV